MAIAGKGGSFKVGATPTKVAESLNWKLDLGADMIDTTNMDSNGWKEFIAGLKEWSGSAEANWKVSTDTTGQKVLQDAYLNGTTVSVTLDVNGTNKYTGNILIKKLAVDTSIKDQIKVSFDMQGTGALAYT